MRDVRMKGFAERADVEEVTDFLAALTDRSAVRLYRELKGTELAGARGVG